MHLYDFSVKKPNSTSVSLGDYAGKVLLIVNTATKCGLAPQFEGLEQLWKHYGPDDFVVLGFPCAQFAGQEPETDATVESVCQLNFGVTFPLFAKIDVNGESADPLYEFLKKEKGGLFGSAIKWNFTKFLIDREGNVVKRYAPTTKPEKIVGDIEKLLTK